MKIELSEEVKRLLANRSEQSFVKAAEQAQDECLKIAVSGLSNLEEAAKLPELAKFFATGRGLTLLEVPTFTLQLGTARTGDSSRGPVQCYFSGPIREEISGGRFVTLKVNDIYNLKNLEHPKLMEFLIAMSDPGICKKAIESAVLKGPARW